MMEQTKEEIFTEKAIKIHGNKYDYSKVKYINNNTKVCIICPEHGEFYQTPHNHLKGCNCPECSGVKKPTTNEWIEKAKKIHGDKYDYSKVNYIDGKTKVCIICPEHGEFWQIANNHLKGEGCIKCRNDKMAEERKMPQDTFILKSKEVHGNKYDYSKVDYINNSTKVCIICPEHGEFYQTPNNHLKGQGCPFCFRSKKIKMVNNKENNNKDFKTIFFERFYNIYGDKYDYSESVYVNATTKIAIRCPKHGIFYKTPSKHLYQGCPECKKEELKGKTQEKRETYILKANETHKNKYDYSELIYNGRQNKVKIICHNKDKNGTEHGPFLQNANSHLNGCGCPKCAQEERTKKQTNTTEIFIDKAVKLFPNFDYSEVNYINNTTPVKIICHKKNKNGQEHGEFYVAPNKLLGRGTNCPHCSHFVSKPELEIYDFLKDLVGEDKILYHDRTILDNGSELDIYLPTYNIAIEFNGLFWHSDYIDHISKDSHIEKTKICEEKGIHLVQIFSDEYFEHKEIVLSKIKHMLGKCENLPKIYARKCEIKEVDINTSKIFLNNNHLQGYCPSSVRLGLFYNGELVSLMTFGPSRHFIGHNDKKWELIRFCNKLNKNVIGGASKLFKYFLNLNISNEIVSYADKRWSDGKLYDVLGFVKYNESKPNYYYIINGKREYRFNLRKQILMEKYNCPKDKTEKMFCKEMNWYRIYDCGCLCYKWENK